MYPAIQKTLVIASFSLLLFTEACGSGGGSSTTPGITGNFSNASLNGPYAFTFQGTNGTGGFTVGGVFTADGNGNLTAGTVDFMQGTLAAPAPLTGTYLLHRDGTGNLNLNFSGGGAIQFGVSLLDSSHLYLIETDPSATGVGLAEKQDTTAFTTPSGTFVFRLHVFNASSNVGAMTFTGGTITGSEDTLAGTGLSSPTLSGTISAPGRDGRGTLVLTTAA